MGSVEDLASRLGVDVEANNSFDWVAVEHSVGLKLPDDYKRLAELFPAGWFQGFIELIRPGDVDGSKTDFLGYYTHRLEDMRRWREDEPARFPFPIFPEPGGLLPWGTSRNSDLFFWLTELADPNAWPVVAADRDFGSWVKYEHPVCDFLDDVVSGRFDGGPSGAALSGEAMFEELQVEAPKPPEPATFWLNQRWGQDLPTNDFQGIVELLGSPELSTLPSDWGDIERMIGFPLPADYQWFIDHYGAGVFCDITITAPAELPELIGRKYEQAASNAERLPYDAPVHPEPGGMIPWGETADGWTCCWAPTDVDPDKWGTVCADPTLQGFEYSWDKSFSSLLVGYARSGGAGYFLGRDNPWSGSITFTPLG
ncbi:hypothetical protein SAMN04488564_11561 [Lentzea waywayandensis]|uniref:SMI1 / KNR4 family (SUKH-1) n=1 Tax=Lentzea waywayandensis TaxID=84724 RepID=A0A1I6FFP0_9PSEU|nr:SMI1/KNR4 family protein [Lentzea waywayandensis]SFR28753.1 hypothetical protein SAMN04488564_11561 [Lentzea waywayandensis]